MSEIHISEIAVSTNQPPEYFSAKDFRLAKEGEGKYIAINKKTNQLYYTANKGERASISKVRGLINKAIKEGQVEKSNLSILDDRFCSLLEKAKGEQKGLFKRLRKASLTITEKLFLRTIKKESNKSIAQEALYNLNHREDPPSSSGYGTSGGGFYAHVSYSDMSIEASVKDGKVTAEITKNGQKHDVEGDEALQILEACKNRSGFFAQQIADTIKAQIRDDVPQFLENKRQRSFHDPETGTTINFKFDKGVITCEAYKNVDGVKKKIALNRFATRELRDLVYPDIGTIKANVKKAVEDRLQLMGSMTESVMGMLGFSGAPRSSEQESQIFTSDNRRWRIKDVTEDEFQQIDGQGQAVTEEFQDTPYKLS